MTRSDAAVTAAVLFALLGVCALTWLARRERRVKAAEVTITLDNSAARFVPTGEPIRFASEDCPNCGPTCVFDFHDEALDWDPPTVPASRLNAASGFVTIGGKILHRSCVDDRNNGRPIDCPECAGRLGMATTGGAG